jgi:hypothetical protein
LALLARNEVPVTFDHLRRLVPNPAIDEPLVNSRGRAIRTERVTENVPTASLVPVCFTDRTFEVVMCLVPRYLKIIDS